MEKQEIKKAILLAISDELELWLDASEQSKSGYEFEKRFMFHMRKVNLTILENSVGVVPVNRNKKKTPYLLWGNRNSQTPSNGTDKKSIWD